MEAQQEQPTFAAGDRFRLRRPIEVLDITREQEDLDATFWDNFSAGLKGHIEEKGIWEEELDGSGEITWYFYLRFDAFPDRLVMYIANEWHGGPFECVAAKAISLN